MTSFRNVQTRTFCAQFLTPNTMAREQGSRHRARNSIGFTVHPQKSTLHLRFHDFSFNHAPFFPFQKRIFSSKPSLSSRRAGQLESSKARKEGVKILKTETKLVELLESVSLALLLDRAVWLQNNPKVPPKLCLNSHLPALIISHPNHHTIKPHHVQSLMQTQPSIPEHNPILVSSN